MSEPSLPQGIYDRFSKWAAGPLPTILLWCAVLVLAGIILGNAAAFLSRLSPVLTPFLIAAFLAYLGNPLVVRFQRFGLGRAFSVCIVLLLLFFLTTLIIILLLPSLERQITVLLNKIPIYRQRIETDWLPYLHSYLPESVGKAEFVNYLRDLLWQVWPSILRMLSKWISSLWGPGAKLVAFATNLFIVPVVTFYLLRDWDKVLAAARLLIPGKVESRLLLVVSECDDVMAAFIRGQLLVMITLGLFYAIGLRLIGLELALLVGLIAGTVSFIPYLGTIVGLVLAVFASLLQFGDSFNLMLAIGVFTLGQVLESVVFTPWLVGDKIGLHPVLVIFAVLAGGHLFGFTGVLVALPVAAIIAATIRHFYRLYALPEPPQPQSPPPPQSQDAEDPPATASE